MMRNGDNDVATQWKEFLTMNVRRTEDWHHPLIRHAPARLDRRRLIALAGGAALATYASAAAAQTPVVEASGDQDAVALLTAAATAMAELDTFTFSLETTRGTTRVMDLFDLESVYGSVRRPFDFDTTIVASLGVGTIDLRAVGVEGTVYIQDPLSNDESYTTVSADPTVLAFVNPDFLLLQAVRIVQNAQLDGTEDFQGTECSVVIGTADVATLLSVLQDVGGGEDAGMFSGENSPFDTDAEPLDVIVWVDDDDRIRGIEFAGGIFRGEAFNVTRLLTFSEFDEPVRITAPDA